MPLIQDTVGMIRCPKCHTSGPHNFRLEQRASFKGRSPEYADMIGGVVEVWACVQCGHILKEIK